ncbi:MAG: response regulator [Calditrichaeota bacterium]|nr:response regulator [Calditrichota bacterium]
MNNFLQSSSSTSERLKCSVLLVEDEWLQRWSLQRALSAHGFKVFSAADGREALQTLACQPVDWLICDYNLPGMDGLEVIEQARRIHAGLNIALVTACGTPDLERRAQKLGAYYIAKPQHIQTIVNLLKNSI